MWTVSIQRRTPGSQCAYFTTNPQGGGFGMNTSDSSLQRAEARAAQSIPQGEEYRLVVNGRDRGVRVKGG